MRADKSLTYMQMNIRRIALRAMEKLCDLEKKLHIEIIIAVIGYQCYHSMECVDLIHIV